MAYKDKEKQRAFQRKWQAIYHIRRRDKMIALFGGRCSKCGYDTHKAALQFDHKKPVMNSRIKRRSGVRLIQAIMAGRIKKSDIQMLCANCHAIKTFEVDRLLFKNRIP